MHLSRRSLLVILAAAGLTPALLLAADPAPKGLRVFTCAHSFHSFVPKQLEEIAKSAGINDHVLVGMSAIGGSRVIQHWDANDAKHQAKEALMTGKVDVLTLAPIWMPDEGIDKFAELALKHNPNIRITVQEFWLPNDTYEPKYPLDVKKGEDHNAVDLAELKKNQDKYDHDVDEYCRGINQRLGRDVIVTVPVGQAAVVLRQKLAAGETPGLHKQWDLFRDSWGHPQTPLQILDSYCHYAVIYQRSPVGLPMPTPMKSNPEWGEKLNRMLQELAWEAVTHAPMSGVKAAAK